MTQPALQKFMFYRTDEVVEQGGVKANRGILVASSTVYFTIERDVERYVNIPFGTYILRMEYSPTKTINGKRRQQFRIMGHNVVGEHGGLANLLIHQGKYPGTLEGCIAPGKMIIPGGVDQSDLAMEELFIVCGGFQEKDNAALLEVVTKPVFAHPWKMYPVP